MLQEGWRHDMLHVGWTWHGENETQGWCWREVRIDADLLPITFAWIIQKCRIFNITPISCSLISFYALPLYRMDYIWLVAHQSLSHGLQQATQFYKGKSSDSVGFSQLYSDCQNPWHPNSPRDCIKDMISPPPSLQPSTHIHTHTSLQTLLLHL